MKRYLVVAALCMLTITIVASGCSSSKKCGCPNKQGYVGY